MRLRDYWLLFSRFPIFENGQEKGNSNSRFYAGPESQHGRRVAKKKKDKKKTTARAFTLIRKGNTVDGSPKKKKKGKKRQ